MNIILHYFFAIAMVALLLAASYSTIQCIKLKIWQPFAWAVVFCLLTAVAGKLYLVTHLDETLLLGLLSDPFSASIINLVLVLIFILIANAFRVSNYYISKKLHRWLAGLLITYFIYHMLIFMISSIIITSFININLYDKQYIGYVKPEDLQLACSNKVVLFKINKAAQFQYLCHQPGNIGPSTITMHTPPAIFHDLLSDQENQQFKQVNQQWDVND